MQCFVQLQNKRRETDLIDWRACEWSAHCPLSGKILHQSARRFYNCKTTTSLTLGVTAVVSPKISSSCVIQDSGFRLHNCGIFFFAKHASVIQEIIKVPHFLLKKSQLIRVQSSRQGNFLALPKAVKGTAITAPVRKFRPLPTSH